MLGFLIPQLLGLVIEKASTHLIVLMNGNDLTCLDPLQPLMSTNYGMEILVLARTFGENKFFVLSCCCSVVWGLWEGKSYGACFISPHYVTPRR